MDGIFKLPGGVVLALAGAAFWIFGFVGGLVLIDGKFFPFQPQWKEDLSYVVGAFLFYLAWRWTTRREADGPPKSAERKFSVTLLM